MAHRVSPEVFTPGFEGKPVTTETQTKLKDYTLEDVHFILYLLAYNNTGYSRTASQLEREYGIVIHPSTLRNWVSSLFTQKYVQIQHELEQQITDKLSAEYVDLAAKASEVEAKALERGIETVDELRPHEVSSAVKNYADAAQKNIANSQLLRDKPTSIVKHQSPDDALKVLEELGLLKEAEVVEEES